MLKYFSKIMPGSHNCTFSWTVNHIPEVSFSCSKSKIDVPFSYTSDIPMQRWVHVYLNLLEVVHLMCFAVTLLWKGLPTDFTYEGFFSSVHPLMSGPFSLSVECLATGLTGKTALLGMVAHMTFELCHVREIFPTVLTDHSRNGGFKKSQFFRFGF